MGQSNGSRALRWLLLMILTAVVLLQDAAHAQEGDICRNPTNEAICDVCGCRWNSRQMMMFPFVTLHRCDCPEEFYQYPYDPYGP